MENNSKKPNLLLRLLTLVVTAALILCALALVVYRDRLNLDALKRYVTYRSLTRDSDGQAQSFPYDGAVSDCFADLNGSLLVAGDSGVRLYSPAGVLLADDAVPLTNPVVFSSGKYAVVYDAGGTALRLYTGTQLLLDLETEGALLSATVNSSGWLAVTHQASGRKGAVTVYDAAQHKTRQFNFSTRFVMDALVTEDNAARAAVTVGQQTGGFSSTLALYDLGADLDAGTHYDTEPRQTYDLGSTVSLALRAGSDALRVLGDNALSVCPIDGEQALRYDYSDRYLKSFSLEGDGCAVLLLGKYRAGSAAELVVVDAAGALSDALSLSEQVLSLSAAGRYIGVLTADRLDIYTQDLELYDTLEGTGGARKALMRADGSAMLIGSETAHLYIPS